MCSTTPISAPAPRAATSTSPSPACPPKSKRASAASSPENPIQSPSPLRRNADMNTSPSAEGADGAAWAPPAEFDEYRLGRPLGGGSAGRVFLAHDTVLERPV